METLGKPLKKITTNPFCMLFLSKKRFRERKLSKLYFYLISIFFLNSKLYNREEANKATTDWSSNKKRPGEATQSA